LVLQDAGHRDEHLVAGTRSCPSGATGRDNRSAGKSSRLDRLRLAGLDAVDSFALASCRHTVISWRELSQTLGGAGRRLAPTAEHSG
jgi:hypothetical protein